MVERSRRKDKHGKTTTNFFFLKWHLKKEGERMNLMPRTDYQNKTKSKQMMKSPLSF